MIYTIGKEKSYLDSIERVGEIEKMGRNDAYRGGYAFNSYKDAQHRIDEAYLGWGFAVFGMDANWERDTVQASDGWWHNLLTDATIIVLGQS